MSKQQSVLQTRGKSNVYSRDLVQNASSRRLSQKRVLQTRVKETCHPDTCHRNVSSRHLSQQRVLQTFVTETCPPDTCHRNVSSRHLSQKRVLQTLVPRTLLVMQTPPKARSIPASERVASATLWAHGMFPHTGRPICAFVCLVPCPIALHKLAPAGCASRRSCTQGLHITAPPRPDERPGQGRSSSRKCDMGY